jgi:peptide/nickel transport system ATP-binding protein
MTADPLLDVRGLTKHYPVSGGVFRRDRGVVRAVDGVDFGIAPGETLGLVGESGCGKSTVATTTLRLEEPTDGRILFDGADVTAFDGAELKRFRRRAQPIFQDPRSSFDPRLSVGESVTEPLRVQGVADRETRRSIGTDLLERVGLAAADYDRYPHAFSGGERQRIAVARALSVNPDLVIADEPVSALDVSVQAGVLDLLADIQRDFGLALLFISHDLSVVREVADRIAVMYLGEIVERGPTERVFDAPTHPYTEALVSAIPRPDPDDPGDPIDLAGEVPDASEPPPGCRFHTRCHAVIQPPDSDLRRGTWRSLLELRWRLADGDVDPEAIRAAHDGTAGDRGRGPADDEVRDAIRAAHRLADVAWTPCAETHPGLEPVGDGETACLLHDRPEAGGSWTGVVDPPDSGPDD